MPVHQQTLPRPVGAPKLGGPFLIDASRLPIHSERMCSTPRFAWAAFWLGSLICPVVHAQEEATSNAVFVCEVLEIPSTKLPAPSDDPNETHRTSIRDKLTIGGPEGTGNRKRCQLPHEWSSGRFTGGFRFHSEFFGV